MAARNAECEGLRVTIRYLQEAARQHEGEVEEYRTIIAQHEKLIFDLRARIAELTGSQATEA